MEAVRYKPILCTGYWQGAPLALAAIFRAILFVLMDSCPQLRNDAMDQGVANYVIHYLRHANASLLGQYNKVTIVEVCNLKRAHHKHESQKKMMNQIAGRQISSSRTRG